MTYARIGALANDSTREKRLMRISLDLTSEAERTHGGSFPELPPSTTLLSGSQRPRQCRRRRTVIRVVRAAGDGHCRHSFDNDCISLMPQGMHQKISLFLPGIIKWMTIKHLLPISLLHMRLF